MTEKRFTYLDASKNHYIGSFFCNGVPLTNKEVVDLLNENEQLKKHIQELQNHLKRLENENIHNYTLIKEAYETERTAIGKNVLKQLLNNI